MDNANSGPFIDATEPVIPKSICGGLFVCACVEFMELLQRCVGAVSTHVGKVGQSEFDVIEFREVIRMADCVSQHPIFLRLSIKSGNMKLLRLFMNAN